MKQLKKKAVLVVGVAMSLLGMGLNLQSCSVSNKQNCEIEVPTKECSKEILLSSFVDDYKLIPLETTDDNLIAQIDKVKMSGDEVFVFDRVNNAIFTFGLDGKFHKSLFKVGNGPGEYMQLMDFDIQGDTLFALDYGRRCVLKYDKNFNYIDKFHYESFSMQIAVDDKSVYLYNLKTKDEKDYKCSVFDKEGNKMADEFLRPKSGEVFNYIGFNAFCKLNNKVYVSPIFSNYIYSGDDFQVQYHLRFEDKEFPDNLNIEEQDIDDPGFNYIVKNNYYMSDRLFLFDYFIDGERHYYVLDKMNNDRHIGIVTNDLIQDFRFFPRWGDEKYLIEEINAGIVCEYFPTLLETSQLENLSPDDNPVILLYEMKK